MTTESSSKLNKLLGLSVHPRGKAASALQGKSHYRHFLSVCSLLFLSFSASADTFYRDDGSQIQYYLDNPQAENLLVVFQGSDCNSVKHMGSVRTIWQEFMPEAALLTIEKYGIDASLPYQTGERADFPAGYLEHNSIAQRIEDGFAVVNKLKHGYQQVSIAGGSEGGYSNL